MLTIDIPGYKRIQLKYLVLDYNGTISFDGKLKADIIPVLMTLADKLEIFIITADTFGSVEKEMNDLPVRIKIIPRENQAEIKKDFVLSLGAENVVSIGNGRNDRHMVESSELGIIVINEEGASTQAFLHADIICRDIKDSLELLLHEKRLIATLRS